jgi:threonyl-tRNA synthetase
MLIVGEKEAETNTLAVRKHGIGDIGVLTVEEFAAMIKEEIKESNYPFYGR